MFKLIKRCVTAKANHAWINVSLPAIESTNSDGNYCAVVDPKLSSQDILDELKKYWPEEYLCRNMLTRFIAVLADNTVRTTLEKYCVENPDAKQDDINSFMQAYMDAGWNVELQHLATERQAQTVKTKQTKAVNVLKDADTEVQTRVAKQMLDANPELAKELAKLLK